jgi:uncharacterized protein (TIGR02246 family)
MPQTPTQTPTIEALHSAWIAAFNRDLDAHMGLYTQDATLFGSKPELSVGKAAIRAYFSVLAPQVSVRRYPMPRIAMLSPDVAATAGEVDFADGDKVLPYRMTWLLVKQGGAWRIVQHHGSPRV